MLLLFVFIKKHNMLRIGRKPTTRSIVVLGAKPRGPVNTLGRKPNPLISRRIAAGPSHPGRKY
jgi:hypothetical protein